MKFRRALLCPHGRRAALPALDLPHGHGIPPDLPRRAAGGQGLGRGQVLQRPLRVRNPAAGRAEPDGGAVPAAESLSGAGAPGGRQPADRRHPAKQQGRSAVLRHRPLRRHAGHRALRCPPPPRTWSCAWRPRATSRGRSPSTAWCCTPKSTGSWACCPKACPPRASCSRTRTRTGCRTSMTWTRWTRRSPSRCGPPPPASSPWPSKTSTRSRGTPTTTISWPSTSSWRTTSRRS